MNDAGATHLAVLYDIPIPAALSVKYKLILDNEDK